MLIVSEGRKRSCASVWAAHVFLIQSHWIKETSKTREQSQQLLNPPFPHCYERSTYCVGKGEWEHVCVNVHECIPVVGNKNVSHPVGHPISSAGINLLIKTDWDLLC